MSIGDIVLTQNSVVVPQGRFALRGSSWTVQDGTVVTQAIPTWAIVLAVIFALACFLGLLFLLVKETRYSGAVTVSVMGPGFYHTTQLPPGPANYKYAFDCVNYARQVTAAA
jgi:hypothetical protein